MKIYMQTLIVQLMIATSALGMDKTESIDKKLDQKIFIAVKEFDISQLEKLIEQGANINARDDVHGATALHWAIGTSDMSSSKNRSLAMARFSYQKNKNRYQ